MKKPSTALLKRPLVALASGITGAVTLTLVHEAARRLVPYAPRMDVLGMRAIARGMYKFNERPPAEETLFRYSILGDIISNSLYYSLTGTGRKAWWRGAALGLAAGVGGVALPGPMGLGTEPSGRTPQTKAMTVALYFLGGLAAATLSRVLFEKPSVEELDEDDVAVV
ncbi:hypothetical protein [Adhaeribacter aquaticus]|uniref:hypothetical protein n=1 Tax=Adhaeribacter aquaticus TaxID=299567 RepID=UPI000687750E|nr:hypothetical protein [Adhaeribacter aquaticus]